MDLGLTQKRAFVAASSAGLGRAVADGLLAEGADVMLCARGAERLEATRGELSQRHGRPVHALVADVGQSAAAAQAVEQAATRLGGLDILVTNSGGPPPGPFISHDEAAWRGAVELLLLSTVAMVRAALPHLRRSPQPRIIHIASTSVKQPIVGLVLSNAVRAAVVGLGKTLAAELGPEGILVNTVCPGVIDTDRIRHLDAASGRPLDEVARERIAQVPLGRIGRPDEFAAMVVFLASARASYLTGNTIQVDGGLVKAVY